MQRRLPQLTALALSLLACTKTTGSVGAVLGQSRDDGRLTVRRVPSGLPAATAGVEVGDEVLLIDGRDVRRLSADEIHRALEGEVGSVVRLTVLRHGTVERVEIHRAPLRSP